MKARPPRAPTPEREPTTDADLTVLAEEWERNAEDDAFWAILSDPSRSGRQWTEADFFETGREEWARVTALLDDLEAWPPERGRFVDFGCGLGRVSRELGRFFRSGIGVDISEQMIRGAKRFNPDIEFLVNRNPDLRIIHSATVDFIYSHIVLQHMPTDLQEVFIGEFMRVLTPGGIAAFQVATEVLPDPRPAWRQAISRLPAPVKYGIKRLAGRGATARIDLRMNVIPHDRVMDSVAARHGTVIASLYTNSTDSGHNGAIRFFDRDAAIERLEAEPGSSPMLSRFYFVRSGRTGTP